METMRSRFADYNPVDIAIVLVVAGVYQSQDERELDGLMNSRDEVKSALTET
jgi:hypothetical protein